MNRAELATIAVALKQESTEDHISILADSSFCITTIRKYTINPTEYKQHLRKDLLQLTAQLLRYRDSNHLKTNIGKFKYNETADKAARAIVEGEVKPDATFEEAESPLGGLRTWGEIRHTHPNKLKDTRKLTNLKAGI